MILVQTSYNHYLLVKEKLNIEYLITVHTKPVFVSSNHCRKISMLMVNSLDAG